ncbi:hypothetical protein TNCV_3148381 [Trichonephila clavipes]|nr:hypothetical protein TNCV_3148381 [Trichonephila clavipes]
MFSKSNDIAERSRCDHQRSERTPALVTVARERIRRKPCRNKILLAKQMNVSKRTMCHPANEDFRSRDC